MAMFDSYRERAALLLVLLGAALIWALAPFATGLIGIPVLYVIFHPVHQKINRRTGVRVSAGLVVLIALLSIVIPGTAFTVLVVSQLQNIIAGLSHSQTIARLGEVQIMGYPIGPRLANAGSKAVDWAGGSALAILGTATRQALNLTIALFGLYYLLLRPREAWETFSSYLPFSDETSGKLQAGFRAVTTSTVIGTGLVALIQGVLLGVAFWALGISNAVFWSMVTIVLSILPILGSGLVWGPAVVSLALGDRWLPAVALTLWGILVVGNVDIVVRPLIFRRYAQIHPLITLVGALCAVPYFGLLGLLIGPLALSYFFEILKVYREEYHPEAGAVKAAKAKK